MSEESEIIEDREIINQIYRNLKDIGIDADIREIHDSKEFSLISCYGKNSNLLFYISKDLYERLGSEE